MAASGAMAGEAVLEFRAAGETFSLPAAQVSEILRGAALTRVPHAPASLLGLANLRGTVLPVMSLPAALGHGAAAPPGAAARIVVADCPGGRMGLRVDEVLALGAGGAARPLDLPALLAREFAALAAAGARRAPALQAGAPGLPGTAEAESESVLLLGLLAGGQKYALPLTQLREVLSVPPGLLAVSEGDAALLGAVPYRGGMLPLVCLPSLLGLPAPPLAQARIIVVYCGGTLLGLVTDALDSVLRLGVEAIDAVPAVLVRGGAEARLSGIARLGGAAGLAGILSTDLLFDSSTQARLSAQAGSGGAMRNASDSTAPGAVAPETGGEERFVIFALGAETYGLPLGAVQEVIRRPGKLTPLPRAPGYVAGVMNLRGRPLPVIEQRQRFAAGGAAPAGGGRIIVVSLGGLLAGFAVDAVSDIAALPRAALAPAPEFGARVFDRVAVSHNGRMILLIDPEALLSQAERDLIADLPA